MSTRGQMTIAVLVKQVPDMNAIRIDRTSGRIVPSGQLVMSSYDEYAVEAALRLKEAFGGEVRHPWPSTAICATASNAPRVGARTGRTPDEVDTR